MFSLELSAVVARERHADWVCEAEHARLVQAVRRSQTRPQPTAGFVAQFTERVGRWSNRMQRSKTAPQCCPS